MAYPMTKARINSAIKPYGLMVVKLNNKIFFTQMDGTILKRPGLEKRYSDFTIDGWKQQASYAIVDKCPHIEDAIKAAQPAVKEPSTNYPMTAARINRAIKHTGLKIEKIEKSIYMSTIIEDPTKPDVIIGVKSYKTLTIPEWVKVAQDQAAGLKIDETNFTPPPVRISDLVDEIQEERKEIKKSFHKVNDLSPECYALLVDYLEDAGNWSGTPPVGCNIESSEADKGYLTDLKKKDYITTDIDPDSNLPWITFSRKSRDLAANLNINLGIEHDAYYLDEDEKEMLQAKHQQWLRDFAANQQA